MDYPLLETAARQYIDTYGAIARWVLEQRAEAAEREGLPIVANSWRDLASQTASLLRHHQRTVNPAITAEAAQLHHL